MPEAENEKLIGVIDAGTRTVKFCIFKSQHNKELLEHAVDIVTYNPEEGWHEQEPMEILNAVYTCITEGLSKLGSLGYKTSDIVTIGITNQRETTIVWDKTNGKALCRAIGKEIQFFFYYMIIINGLTFHMKLMQF